MAENLEEYKSLFRDSHVEAEETLWGIHVLIYIVVNFLWVMANMLFVPSRYRWIMIYPLVGWGTMVFVHWWFFVKNAERLCMRREERIEKRMASKASSSESGV
jgi:hypothetical protein